MKLLPRETAMVSSLSIPSLDPPLRFLSFFTLSRARVGWGKCVVSSLHEEARCCARGAREERERSASGARAEREMMIAGIANIHHEAKEQIERKRCCFYLTLRRTSRKSSPRYKQARICADLLFPTTVLSLREPNLFELFAKRYENECWECSARARACACTKK